MQVALQFLILFVALLQYYNVQAKPFTLCSLDCESSEDCGEDGQLICLSGKCSDDPKAETHFCDDLPQNIRIRKSSPIDPSLLPPPTPLGCFEDCRTDGDCRGELACESGKCLDDPDIGGKLCQDGPSDIFEEAQKPSFALGRHECNQKCKVEGDCVPQLTCISGKCTDDPHAGTYFCRRKPRDTPETSSSVANNGCLMDCDISEDCGPLLVCFSGKCRDDPEVGSHLCDNQTERIDKAMDNFEQKRKVCKPSGTLQCVNAIYDKFECSPPIDPVKTPAVLTLDQFEQLDPGLLEAAALCDGKFHNNSDLVAAISTGWFDHGTRCGKKIEITAQNGNSAVATVVDECDSRHGCDESHGFQKPCGSNVLAVSKGVWQQLGIGQNDATTHGTVCVYWHDA